MTARADGETLGKITDEDLAAMRERIGVVETYSRPWNSSASADAVWHFALGMGDDNPMWWDRSYAESSPVGRMFAPPAFLYSLTHEVSSPGEPAKFGDVEWLPGVPGLWLGDRWVWHSRIWVGEDLTASRELCSVRERTGSFLGRSVTHTERFRFAGEGGRPIAEMHRTVLRFDAEAMSRSERYIDVPVTAYSERERQALIDQYASESAARRGSQPRYWQDVEVGDALSPIVKGPLTITGMIGWLLGWGADQIPTNRILYRWLGQHPAGRLTDPRTGIDETLLSMHWDAEKAHGIGMPRAFDFGAQRIAFTSHLLTDWAGDEGELVELDATIRAPQFLGDMTLFSGTVVSKTMDEGTGLVSCSVIGTNQRGEVNTTATAVIALPARQT
jgi:acyl dehydratase